MVSTETLIQALVWFVQGLSRWSCWLITGELRAWCAFSYERRNHPWFGTFVRAIEHLWPGHCKVSWQYYETNGYARHKRWWRS